MKRIFDVAGLAVQAIGKIQLDAFDPAAVLSGLHFIDVARTEAGTGAAICGIAFFHAYLLVVNSDVAGLILPVKGAGKVDAGQLVHHDRVVPVGSGRFLIRVGSRALFPQRGQGEGVIHRRQAIDQTFSLGKILGRQMDPLDGSFFGQGLGEIAPF